MLLPKLYFKWERWKYNKEFDVYVSTLGNVRDKNKQPIDFTINSSGYFTVRVKNRYQTVHRLVMLTFKPLKNKSDYKGMTVDHINSNKRCNELKNLEWVTKKENISRAVNKLQPNLKFYIYNSYGNRYKSCYDAATHFLKEQGLPSKGKDIQRAASAIGESISQNQKALGIYWYKRTSDGIIYTKAK